MNNLLKLIILSLACLQGNITYAQTVFQKIAGGSADDKGHSLDVCSDNGYIICGVTESFGDVDGDNLLIKTDEYGNIQWSKSYEVKLFGASKQDYSSCVKQCSDKGYVVLGAISTPGLGDYDLTLVKTDSSGNLLWERLYDAGGTGVLGRSLYICSDNGFIVAGGIGSSLLLLKTDSLGVLEWQKTIDGFAGGNGLSIQQCQDNGFIISGSTNDYGAGSWDCLLLKVDSLGNYQWAKTIGGINQDMGGAVKQVFDGGYIVTGSTYSYGAGSVDLFLLKLTVNGNFEWFKTYGTSSDESMPGRDNNLIQVLDSGFVFIGRYNTTGFVYLIKTDNSGSFEWSMTYGDSIYEYGLSVHQIYDTGFVIAGYTKDFVGNDLVSCQFNYVC